MNPSTKFNIDQIKYRYNTSDMYLPNEGAEEVLRKAINVLLKDTHNSSISNLIG